MELRIYIKQLDQFYQGNQVHYTGTNPINLSSQPGPLPAGDPRRWPQYGSFIDVTDYVSDLNALKITFTAPVDVTGVVTPGSQNQKSSISGSLTFERYAYELLKSWLVDDVSARLNAVDVRIEHVGCGTYFNYAIKPFDLQWCQDDTCVFDVVLKQQDEQLTCIKKTLITDNWQGWFPDNSYTPANGKKHPRFSYCNEVRPNGMLIMTWWMSGMNGAILLTMIPLLMALNLLFAIINIIIGVIQTIVAIVGGNSPSQVNWQTLPYFDFKKMLDAYAQQYVESAGCGREHPAPLIRDYISNVCDKCGIEVNEVSAPVFFARTITIETSDRGIITKDNPYYNACYFNAPVKRGIRRFRSLNVAGTGGNNANDTEFWIPDNSPLMTLDEFLDSLKGTFNSLWEVRSGTLYFRRKDYWQQQAYIYDFTEGSPDRDKIVQGPCFSPNELQFPAYCVGIYKPDSVDACGNEAGNVNGSGQMNGIVQFGNTEENPNYAGVLDKAQEFGATRFRLDGITNDYIYDAMQVLCNGSVFTPFTNGLMRDFVAPFIRKYCDYALLLSGETAEKPKIIIWSGDSYLNAKAIKIKAAWPGVAWQPMPDNNPSYNLGQSWQQRHYPDTTVIGEDLTLSATPNGIYRVTDYFGIVITENPAILCNWPMYFEPWYYDTLWDLFHWIDDPNKQPRINMNWSVKIRLCCEDLQKCGVFNDGSAVVLGQKVRLPYGMYPDATINEITVNYDTSDEYGMYIELKGKF